MLALVTNCGRQCWSGEAGDWIGQAAYADDGLEVCEMGSLGPTHLIALLLAVAIIAALCGFIASAVARGNKRRARRFFLVGFVCGLMAGAILRGRRRHLNALGALARCADVCPPKSGIRRGTGRFAVRAFTFAASHVRLGLWPPKWDRKVRM
jgi:uncharacterized membrane protein YeaQ/YmgE (transglycosylase-associated protein family)